MYTAAPLVVSTIVYLAAIITPHPLVWVSTLLLILALSYGLSHMIYISICTFDLQLSGDGRIAGSTSNTSSSVMYQRSLFKSASKMRLENLPPLSTAGLAAKVRN